MNASAVAPLPPETMSSLPHRLDAANGASFVALMAPTSVPSVASESERGSAMASRTESRLPASSARFHRAAEQNDKKPVDSSAATTAPAVAPPPAPPPVGTAATTTNGDTTALAASGTASLPGTLSTGVTANALAATDAGSATADSAGATAAAASPAPGTLSGANTTFAAIAAALGARIAAGAPALGAQPRVALADLAAQDKLAAGGANHSALSLEALQGPAKPTTPVGATIDEKMLADAAKDIAATATSLEHASSENSSTQQTDNAALTGPSGSTDATAATAMAPPPAPIAAAPAPLSPTMLRAAEQLALVLPLAVKSGDNHIRIQLQPAELGGIDVKLSVNHDGRVTMVVSADRSDTLNLLRQDSGTLTQALRDAGLQADSSSLSFNLRGGFSFNQQAANGGAASGAAPSSSDNDIALPAAAQRRHAGSLDIHV